MNFQKLWAGAASVAVVAAAIAPTSAMAQIDPVFGNTTEPGISLDQECLLLLKPSAASDFVTFAEDLASSVSVEVISRTLVSVEGIGQFVDTAEFSGARVNGQSVNIHADRTTTRTYEASRETYEETVLTTTTTSAGCHVHKPTEGNQNDPDHPGYQIAPNGLQTDERVSVTTTEQSTRTVSVDVQGPWVDPNFSGTSQVVICISPTRNPGTWRSQNGYTNQLGRTCSTAWYNELGSTPSVSVPEV